MTSDYTAKGARNELERRIHMAVIDFEKVTGLEVGPLVVIRRGRLYDKESGRRHIERVEVRASLPRDDG